MTKLVVPPKKTQPQFDDWVFRLWKFVSEGSSGGSGPDAPTHHPSLSSLNTAQYHHLTKANHDDLTGGGESTLHYHSSDRARANHTGTQPISSIEGLEEALTGGGAGSSLGTDILMTKVFGD